MKRIKKIVLLLLLFVLSGCTVKYNLTINDDLSVNEKVEATEYTKRMNALTGLEQEQSVNYLFTLFNRDNERQKLFYKTENNETIATVTTSNSSLEEYKKYFTSDVFDKVDIEEDGDLVTLIFEQSKKLTNNSSSSLIYDEIEVNIDIPFEVKENNADSRRGNKYTWKLKKEQDLKTIKITFDKNNKKDEQKFTIGSISFSVKYHVIAFGILGLILLTIVIIVYVKNKKNNRI